MEYLNWCTSHEIFIDKFDKRHGLLIKPRVKIYILN